MAAELRARGAEVEIDDGLALIGRLVHRLVVDGYHCQIEYAPWSWRVLYRVTRSRRLIRLGGAFLALQGGRRLRERIESGRYDAVVSAYPVVSMVLARLRRAGKLRVPCCTLVTDFDPHPAWVHPELDANLGVGGVCTGGMRPVRPPVPAPPDDPTLRPRMRERLGLEPGERAVLIVGGAWGVGHLHDAALTVAAVPGMRPIVVAGHNDGLRRRIDTDPKLDAAVVFGFTGLMAGLMAASDVLIANAGGLTCLEAFAAGLPVVIYDPLPGHGEDNGRHMEQAGMVTAAAREADLQTMLADGGFWAVRAPETAGRALALFERPCTAEQLAALRLVAGPNRALVRARRVAVVTAAVMALGMADKAVDAVAVTHVPAHQGAVVQQWEGR